MSRMLNVVGPCDVEACGSGVIAVGLYFGVEILSWGWERVGGICSTAAR